MKSMSHIEMIRDLAKQGKSYKEICELTHSDYRTVKKYIDCDDFNEPLPAKVGRPAKLDPYKEEICTLIDENRKNWHKQRLTASRILVLMRDAHPEFDVSYPSLQRFVRKYKEQIQVDGQTGYDRLVWHPGEAQADFGEADFYQADGTLRRYKYFVLSFPYANKAFCQIYLGENVECVIQALMNIFTYLGGVPDIIIFDNATGIGRRICKQLQENRVFTQFRLHYRFSARYCNPNAGNEKGNVESNVGYLRRNLFVPIVSLPADVEHYNQTELLSKCEHLMAQRIHYIHRCPVNTLFVRDRQALHELPQKAFVAKRLFRQQTNGYGEVVLDKKHRYSLDSSLRNTPVLVETYPWTVKFYDLNGTLLEELPRMYGDEVTQSINIATSIRNVIQKPNSWHNSVLRDLLDSGNPLKDYLDTIQDTNTIKKTLYRFSDAMETFGYDTVLMAFQELMDRKMDVTNKYNLQACCNRVATFDPQMSHNSTGVSLDKYAILMGHSDHHEGDSHAHQ
jgi:transposase